MKLLLDDDYVLVFGGFEELDELVFAEELPMIVVHFHCLLALSEFDADALELFLRFFIVTECLLDHPLRDEVAEVCVLLEKSYGYGLNSSES